MATAIYATDQRRASFAFLNDLRFGSIVSPFPPIPSLLWIDMYLAIGLCDDDNLLFSFQSCPLFSWLSDPLAGHWEQSFPLISVSSSYSTINFKI